MKNYQCLSLLWLFCVVFGVSSENYSYVERVGNPDDASKIERPCPTYDLNCIRLFFEKHGHCKKTFGPVPDPVTRPQSNLFFSRMNLTMSIVDQKISGLNGRIEEFYLNRDTTKLVIAVEFRSLSQTSDKIFFTFHRRAREPIVTTSAYFVVYDPIIITAVIPKLDYLQLDEAECTAFLTGPIARFGITPNALTSTDLQPTKSVASAFTNLAEDTQELFLTDSTYLIATYIQYNICDFGLLLT